MVSTGVCREIDRQLKVLAQVPVWYKHALHRRTRSLKARCTGIPQYCNLVSFQQAQGIHVPWIQTMKFTVGGATVTTRKRLLEANSIQCLQKVITPVL